MPILHALLKAIKSKLLYFRKRYFLWKTIKPVFKYGPFNSNPNAGTEIHSLVCNKDFGYYVLAIKSFLRFYQNVSIIAHDDGSLTKKQKKILTKNIKGIIIVDKKYADEFMKKLLSNYPYCYKFRSARINMLQTFDCVAHCVNKKMILLDSDTIFIDYPEEIINWIECENQEILYVYEEDPYVPSINNRHITHIEDVPFKFVKHLCGGFVCCYSDIFSLDLIERYCKYVLENCDENIKMYFSQGIVALCVGMSHYKPIILSGRYQNRPNFSFTQNPIFRHYWGSAGLGDEYAYDAKKVISKIAKIR